MRAVKAYLLLISPAFWTGILLEWIPWLLVLTLFVTLIIALSRLSGLKARFRAELSKSIAEARFVIMREAQEKLEEERSKLMEQFQQMFEEWKRREMENTVKVELERWKREKEKEIRRDAIKGSITTLLGKASEHVAPLYMLRELGIDPRDLRFIGTPIDFIAFKGLSDGNPEKIFFIEVKASQSGVLTERERRVKDLVESKKVEWITFNLRKEIDRAFDAIEKELVAAEGVVEHQAPQVARQDYEFYEWLVKEFQITRDEYESLDDETKKLLRSAYESIR
jgi:predicted Holliday junction resolvase-like endonuclease